MSAWNALFAPKGIPQDVAAKLNATLVAALEDANTRKRLLELGVARWNPILRGYAQQ